MALITSAVLLVASTKPKSVASSSAVTKTLLKQVFTFSDFEAHFLGLHPTTFAIWMIGLSGIYIPAFGIGFAYVIGYLFALVACPAVVEIVNAGLGKVVFVEGVSDKDVWFLGRVGDGHALPDSESSSHSKYLFFVPFHSHFH